MNELTPHQLAWARTVVVTERRKGTPQAEIDAFLKAQLGVTSEEVMDPKARDYARAALSGMTLGFNDELAGLGAAIVPGGKGYTEARNDVREYADAARAAAPKRMAAAEIAGGLVPALATAGAGAVGEAGAGVRALRAARAAGALGTVAGAGNSESDSVAGVAKDAAISGAASAALGAGGSILARGAGAVARGTRNMLHPERAIADEAATQLPASAGANVARQEALAPNTAVLASQSPEMQALVRGIGADGKTGVAARLASEERVSAIKAARKAIGEKYDELERQLPVDDELRALAEASDVRLKPSVKEIPFSVVQTMRTAVLEDLRAAKRGSVKRELGDLTSKLNEWLYKHVPEAKQLDADYAHLTERLGAEKKLLTEITNSSKNHAASRAYGAKAGSIGGSLPRGSRGVADLLAGLVGPDKAARARAVNGLLLTPGDATEEALRRIVRLQGARAPSRASRVARNGLLFEGSVEGGKFVSSLFD